MRFLKKIVDVITELVFPQCCIVCGEVIEFCTDKWLCPDCKGKFKTISGKKCDICGVPILADGICSSCRKRKNYFKRAYCAYEYKDEVQRAILRMKFYDDPQSIGYFVDKTAEYAKRRGFTGADLVVPVPMHKSGLKKRGYNQSALLAKGLAKYGFGDFAQPLVKIKRTKNQHELSRKEREKNLSGAFAVPRPDIIKGKKILLVDDIFTTGRTVNECSKTLVKAGASQVEVLCIAVVKEKS